LLNGVLIGYLGLPPFVVTYGMMRIARGLAFSYTGGYCIYGFDPGFRWLGTGFIAGIPAPIFIASGMTVLLCFIAYRTVLGKEIYAVGANRITAKYTGINVKKTLLIVYVMSGVLSAFAGFIYIARLNAAEPIIGEFFVLDAVAATVIGGTSFAGGEGSPIGTLVGALIIAVLQNGLNLMGVPPQWQLVLIGLVIILAVTVDMVAKKV
jgi:ribose transport system permease protein